MAVRIANKNGVISHKGERFLLRAGQTLIDSEHPVVKANAKFFDDPGARLTYPTPVLAVTPAPQPEAKPEPTPEVKGEVEKVEVPDKPKAITTQAVSGKATTKSTGKASK